MTTFNYDTAKKYLSLGKRIRTVEWPDDTFIYFSNDGTYRDENNEIFSFTDDYEEDDFVLQGDDECQTQEIFEKTDESGAKVDGEHSSKLNDESSQTESGNKNLNTKKSEISESENTTSETQQKLTSEPETIITKTEKSESPNEKNGQKITEIDKMKLSASSTPETESTNLRRYSPVENVEILPSDSSDQSENLSLVQSHSMSLIDDSANHLFALMKSIAPHPKTEIYATGTVETSVKIAKELREIMKVKLETLKFAQELKSGNLG